jgi:inhibitor of cysteine peptidase
MRSKISWTIGLLMVPVIFLAGCSNLASEPRLTEKDQSVDLKVGQGFTISLEGNMTTGYTWEVEGLDEKMVSRIGDPEFKPESSLVGAGGIITLRFKALSPGSTTIHLVYHRPWEKDQPPLKTYDLAVGIR